MSIFTNIKVEHYESQFLHPEPEKSLNYRNMLGVCSGISQGHFHCDATRGGKGEGDVRLNRLNPLQKNCEQLITYSTGGQIKSIADNPEIEQDLNEYLNLNNDKLVEYRTDAMDVAKETLKKKYPQKIWTKQLIQKEIEEWNSLNKKQRYRPFCQAVVWFLRWLQAKSRYPNR